MTHVREHFLEPLLRVFSPQRTDDVEGWMQVYEAVLRTFSSDTLAKAAQIIITTRDTRSFPLPAECNHACRDAIFSIAAEKRRPANNSDEIRNAPLEHRYPECSDRNREQADRLFATSSFAHEALKEDWAWTLHDWMRKHGRHPDEHEGRQIRTRGIANSKSFWEMAGSEETSVDFSGLNPCAALLIVWRRNVHDRLRNLTN